jgi:hypothetical protein
LTSRYPFFYAREILDRGLAQMKSTSAAATDAALKNKKRETASGNAYGTTAQLFDEVRDFLAQHPGLTSDSALKLTYFLFATLFPECVNSWLWAAVVAPDPVGSSVLLQMLSSVCLYPLHVGELTLSAMLTLPLSPCPNLLIIDQLTPNKELARVLRVMSRPNAHILRGGKLHNVCIPTLVCTAEPLSDRWILDQAIQVVLTPNRGRLPRFDEQSAQKLRDKLLCYRELNFAKVRDSDFDVPQFASPMREVASMLANSIVDDPSLQRCLLMLFEPQDQHVRISRTHSIAAIAAEAALFLSHESGRRHAFVGEIATIANGILKGRGEDSLTLDPRAVGHQLRAIGLFSQRLGRAGRGIRFAKNVRRTIHELAVAYDVRTPLDNSSCEFCAEFRPRAGDAADRGK